MSNLTADQWNERYPEGQRVRFKDALSSFETTTRSKAWELGHGAPVVSLKGKTGGYLLKFITPLENT